MSRSTSAQSFCQNQSEKEQTETSAILSTNALQHGTMTTNKTTEDHKLAQAVTSKLEAGNFKYAIRIISSNEAPALANEDTLKALQSKHPGPAANRRTSFDPNNNSRFEPLQVCIENVIKALRTFPLGSSGGPDGITPQHIADLLSRTTDDSLLQALTDLVKLLLAGSFDNEVNTII